MESVTQVPVVLFRAVTTALENYGASPERVVEKAGLPLWQSLEPHTPVPGSHLYRIIGRAARDLGAEEFGSLIPRHTPITALDLLGQRIGQSLTVYDAISTLNTLYPQMSSIDVYWAVENEEGLWWLRKRKQAADGIAAQQLELGSLCYMVKIIRLGAGPGWTPEEVRLEADPLAVLGRLEDFGNAAIYPQQGVAGLWVSRSALTREVERPPLGHHGTDSKLFSEVPSLSFLGSIRQLTRTYSFFGHPKIEEIADAIGLHPRTLQRRLASEGVSFKQLVDEVRFQRARELLRDPQVKLIEIAAQLGYSEQANFNHAFRRWAGVSPTAYRHHLYRD